MGIVRGACFFVRQWQTCQGTHYQERLGGQIFWGIFVALLKLKLCMSHCACHCACHKRLHSAFSLLFALLINRDHITERTVLSQLQLACSYLLT